MTSPSKIDANSTSVFPNYQKRHVEIECRTTKQEKLHNHRVRHGPHSDAIKRDGTRKIVEVALT